MTCVCDSITAEISPYQSLVRFSYFKSLCDNDSPSSEFFLKIYVLVGWVSFRVPFI